MIKSISPKSKKTVLSTSWFFVESLEYPEHGMTSDSPYYRIVEPDGVVILAVTPEHKILLVRQFRPALGEYTFELPAGGINPGESAADAAKRELYEETGYRSDDIILLSEPMQLLGHRSTIKSFIFLANDAIKDESSQLGETTEVQEVTLDKLKTMAQENSFSQLPGLGVILLWLWYTNSQ